MSVLDAARKLAPVLSERAAEGEAGRTMPADLVEQVRAAGLFHMAMPEALGGPPEPPATIIEVVEEISRADGSAGWTTLIGNATCFAAWLEPSAALDVLAGRPEATVAGAFSPGGQAVLNEDGSFIVSGRWPFASGAPHADWFVNGVLVMEGQGPSGPPSGELVPRMLENGLPDWRFVWLPAADVEVLDTWWAAGLRGTGSHHVAAEGVRVPLEHTAAPLYERARAQDPFFVLPFWSILMVVMAGFPLGVARRALDEFVGLTEGKSRRFDRRRMSEDEMIQVEVARLDGVLGAARAYVFDVARELRDTVDSGREVSIGQRVRITSAVHHAVRSGLQVVDTAFRMAGGGALYDSSPLQRCFRDLHAGAQHIAFSAEVERGLGRALLGQDPATVLL